MPRGTWITQIKSGGSWISDGTIYRPNSDLAIRKISTQSKTKLADGSNAYISPAIKYTDEPLAFVWLNDDGTTKTKVEGYITSRNDVKIIDHNANEYIGRFISIDPKWISGLADDTYDIRAIFEQMPGLA